MIQVLGRLFTILEFLSHEEKATTSQISRAAGLKKTTASNILRTLAGLGYLEANELHEYHFSDRFMGLVEANMGRDALMRAAKRAASDLAERMGEAVVVAALRKDRYYAIAEALYERTVTVHSNVYSVRPIYQSVTGRILLAFGVKEERNRVMKAAGSPGSDWPEAGTAAGLERVLRTIRRDRYTELRKADIYAVGVPVFGVDGGLLCAIGLYMPLNRFHAARRRTMLAGLRQASAMMRRAMEVSAWQETASNEGTMRAAGRRGGKKETGGKEHGKQ